MSVFVDTGAWFAYFVRRDSDHNSARSWVSTNESPLVTSDYILDELFTLLKIRESHVVAVAARLVFYRLHEQSNYGAFKYLHSIFF